MNGKLAIAPCGHIGEFVVGQFVQCLTKGCDGLPPGDFSDDDVTPTLNLFDIFNCTKCQSTDTKPFPHASFSPGLYHCIDCGNVWRP